MGRDSETASESGADPFYERLNQVLEKAGLFDAFVVVDCARGFTPTGSGGPSLQRPGRYFRMLSRWGLPAQKG